MARLTLRRRLARVHPFVWVGIAAVVGALVAWPLGGWDTVVLESTKIPEVGAGTRVDAQQFAVQVDSAELAGIHPDGFTETEPGWEFLILDITVTNMTAETQLSLRIGDESGGSVTVDGGIVGVGTTMKDPDGYIQDPDIYLRTDDTLLPDLQPRLAAPLELIWQVPVGTWKVGQQLTVGVIDRSPYECTLEVGTCYRDARVTATVAIPVEQGPVAVPDDEGAAP
jgi:hypothetical protein